MTLASADFHRGINCGRRRRRDDNNDAVVVVVFVPGTDGWCAMWCVDSCPLHHVALAVGPSAETAAHSFLSGYCIVCLASLSHCSTQNGMRREERESRVRRGFAQAMILFGCSFNVLASVQYPQPHPTDSIQGWKCVVGEVCVCFFVLTRYL